MLVRPFLLCLNLRGERKMPAKYTGNNKQTSVPSPKQTGIKVTKKTVNMKELYPVNVPAKPTKKGQGSMPHTNSFYES